MFRPKVNLFKQLWITLIAYTIGIPTGYGFRLRLRKFMVLKSISEELHSLKTRYEFALQLNEKQDGQIRTLSVSLRSSHADNRRLHAALKEIATNPSALSEETQALLESLKATA